MINGEQLVRDMLAELTRLRLALEARTHDIEAYRGSLGYSVRGDHDGRLSDGTLLKNGIADALHAQVEARTQERDDLVCGIPIREKQLTDYTKRVEAAKDAAKAKVQALEGLFCEAHGFNQLQPDVSCPMCEAVHADDDLKRAQQQLASLQAALQGLAASMRTEYATSGYRRLLHYAERLKEALVRPTEPQKGKD